MFSYIYNNEHTECHQQLISSDNQVELTASSLAPESVDTEASSADRARLDTREVTGPGGKVRLSAWVPAVSDTNQWIQVQT